MNDLDLDLNHQQIQLFTINETVQAFNNTKNSWRY